MATDIKIIGADTTDGDLLVTFSDQTTILFEAGYLYKVRDENGNHEVEELQDADRKD